jgi:hypothetical protein
MGLGMLIVTACCWEPPDDRSQHNRQGGAVCVCHAARMLSSQRLARDRRDRVG